MFSIQLSTKSFVNLMLNWPDGFIKNLTYSYFVPSRHTI